MFALISAIGRARGDARGYSAAFKTVTMSEMRRTIYLMPLLLFLCGGAWTQQESKSDEGPGANQAPPRSERNQEAEESSSRDTRIDLRPPKDDARNHPESAAAVADAEGDSSGTAAEGDANGSPDVQEFHPWDPHRAMKDVEVGDFYFKRKNFRAALDRYSEALYYKDNDALATFGMAQCQEKLGLVDEARNNYQGYLKILPHGPLAAEAQKGIERLNTDGTANRK